MATQVGLGMLLHTSEQMGSPEYGHHFWFAIKQAWEPLTVSTSYQKTVPGSRDARLG